LYKNILDDMEFGKSKKLDNEWELDYLKKWHLSNINLGCHLVGWASFKLKKLMYKSE
jgi:hypothetical protein